MGAAVAASLGALAMDELASEVLPGIMTSISSSPVPC